MYTNSRRASVATAASPLASEHEARVSLCKDFFFGTISHIRHSRCFALLGNPDLMIKHGSDKTIRLRNYSEIQIKLNCNIKVVFRKIIMNESHKKGSEFFPVPLYIYVYMYKQGSSHSFASFRPPSAMTDDHWQFKKKENSHDSHEMKNLTRWIRFIFFLFLLFFYHVRARHFRPPLCVIR